MALKRRNFSATVIAVAGSVALIGAVTPVANAQSSAFLIPNLSSGSSLSGEGQSSFRPGEDDDNGNGEAPTAPKNIIYMVGDGMGYNHVAATNLYETGQTLHQVEGEAGDVSPVEGGEAVQVYEGEGWNEVGMSTYQAENSYDPEKAWADHNYVNENFTDSAAAGTAMATGVKTHNGSLGVDTEGETIKNTSEHALENDKAAGVVSSVPVSHATPAAWAAHNTSRNAYHEIAEEMVNGDLDVIMGAGHPFFDNDNQPVEEAGEGYMSVETYEKLVAGETDFEFFEEDADFESLAAGEVEDDTQYFGLAQVNSTLQHDRSGESTAPYDVELNDVVDLATMSAGALNVLGQDEDGFHLMIEGGAIDWAGHANDMPRDIEEVQAFNEAVETVVDWVETNSSWEETLVIVTADHETGYMAGPNDDPNWSPMTGEEGQVPDHGWHSDNHTNQLVPVFFRGAGSEDILEASTANTDPVRGAYIDNVDIANLTFNNWWARD